jgi:hypothetical protein
VLAAASAVELAAPAEKKRWALGDETVLRGRLDTTRLAVPRTPPRRPMATAAS